MGIPSPVRLSVLIPAYNEAELLPRSLDAVMPQVRRVGAEVIVIDNNSTDDTATIARAHGATVVTEPRQGYTFALDRGIREAQGEIVAVTDADTIVSPDWLERITRRFDDPSVVGVTGIVRFAGLPLVHLIRYLLPRDLWGANMAFRRSAALAVGGIDPTVNLAVETVLSRKLQANGRIVFDPRISVRTSSRRYQAQPLRQSVHYAANYAWLRLFRRPLFWDFAAVRDPAEVLKRKMRRNEIAFAFLVAAVTVAYSFIWPSSTDFGSVTVRADADGKVVALTFDDGPNGNATRAIVDILKAKDVPATFFEVGRSVTADPATTAYVSANGFPIGNHTWDHTFKLPLEDRTTLRRELGDTSHAIEGAAGHRPTLFRPPHGFRSPQMLLEAKSEKLRVIDWSVDPRDYLTDNPATITSRVLDDVKPGSIVLLHDGLQDGPRVKTSKDRRGTIAALPTIIDGLRQRGYTFVTIEDLLRNRQG